jgi:hypothetical protein
MTPAELYQFDTAGYLVIPDALARHEVGRYNARIDHWRARARARRDAPADRAMDVAPVEFCENTERRVNLDDPINHDQAFLDLVDHPRVLPCIWDLVLMPRFKSSWLTLTWRGGTVGGHGGHAPWYPCNFYHADRGGIACNLLNVMWVFSDIAPGGGGLSVIPGSHKSNFPLPPAGPAPGQLVEIAAPAGSVILFTHDIYHESLNRSDRERRVLFLTYCPSVIANSHEGGDGHYDRLFAEAPEGSWRKYLLRRPHGYRELHPQPPRQIPARSAAQAPPPEPAPVA